MTMIANPTLDGSEGPFMAGSGHDTDGGIAATGAETPAADEGDDDARRVAAEAAAEAAKAAMLRAIGIAETLFTDAADDFTRLSRAIGHGVVGGGDDKDLKEAVGQARGLRAAAQTMMDERNRIDKLRKEVGGGIGGAGSLDLDAARDEIGRRLACLRRAGGG